MAIRIDRIHVHRGGPLEQDFVLNPGDLNLIYGRNETGKTYVVESIINLLFATGRRSPANWNLRGWNLAGRIVISGLQKGKVTFTEASTKLDDYWEDEAGLPRNLSRLLIVKAGETRVTQESDGIGRQILKDYLSGEGMLDRIAARVSATLQKATLAGDQITGSNMEELKSRRQLRKDRDKLDSLIKDVEDGYGSAEIHSLRLKQEALKAELLTLEKAKRYHAARLDEELEAKKLEAGRLPSDEELTNLESEISVYESDKFRAQTKSATLDRLRGASEDYRWTEKALGVYQEIMRSQAGTAQKQVYISLALAFLAGTGAVVSGLLGFTVALIVCAIALTVLLSLAYLGVRRAVATAGYSKELEDLRTAYKDRFGSDLTDLAAISEKVGMLQEDHIRAGSLKTELDEDLLPGIQMRKNAIKVALKQLADSEVPTEEWRDAIRELRDSASGLQNDIRSLEKTLARLDMPREDYLDDDPGLEWNRADYESLVSQLTVTEQTLEEENRQLDRLKTRVVQETGSQTADWEELITTLRDRREKTAQEYNEITAEILAKLQVNAAIQEFREEENARIDDGLKREELTKPLLAVTQRYSGIRHDQQLGLVVGAVEGEEFPLSAISTGAQEQAFLALRLGFASIAMEGETAFLILDDAFQHSDWVRRENLIAQFLRLVEADWQVFYFTMDDHIRERLCDAGEGLGDRFQTMGLGGNQ